MAWLETLDLHSTSKRLATQENVIERPARKQHLPTMSGRLYAVFVILLALGVFSSFISSITSAVNTLRAVRMEQMVQELKELQEVFKRLQNSIHKLLYIPFIASVALI